MTNIEYNTTNDFISPNDTGTGTELALIPGSDIYYRVKATDSNFVSGIDTLIVPARPSAPVYSIDYFSETTNESVGPEYEYSDTSIMIDLLPGSGTVVSLNPGKDLYFRKVATDTSFSGETFRLEVQERAGMPVVSLDDRNSAAARFKKSPDGTGEDVLLTDGYEYSLDDGQSWMVIDNNTTVDATGIKNIKVRVKATISSFASPVTWNMDIDPPPKVWFFTEHICKNSSEGLLIYTDIGCGLAYIVLEDQQQADTSDLRIAVEAGKGAVAMINIPGIGISFPVADLPEGLYFTYAVDTFGTMSEKLTKGIHVYDPPLVYFQSVDDLCEGDNPVLLPNGIPDGGTYSGAAVIDGSFIPYLAGPGEHEVVYTYTDSNGCIASYSRLVKVVKPPGINLGPDRKICRGVELELDAGSGFKTYYWTPGGLITRKIIVSEAGDYEVTGITNEGCESADAITISVQYPYQDEKICLVTVNLQTGKNMIIWEKTPDVGTAYFTIYRETSITGNYIPIGTVPYSNLSIFIDTVAEPEKQPFLYKISVTDSCGNESDMSPYHKTLFLQYSPSHEGNNLSWREYGIENGQINFITYEIYRGVNKQELLKLDDVSSNVDVYTDTDPDALSKLYYYRLGGVKSIPCHPASAKKAEVEYSRSMSNMVDNSSFSNHTGDNVLSDGIMIYPNPFKLNTTIYFNNPRGHSYTLCITDLSGKICKVVDGIITSEYLLEKRDMKEGLYILELRGEKIFREKIIVK
jgi:hypothetical protein